MRFYSSWRRVAGMHRRPVVGRWLVHSRSPFLGRRRFIKALAIFSRQFCSCVARLFALAQAARNKSQETRVVASQGQRQGHALRWGLLWVRNGSTLDFVGNRALGIEAFDKRTEVWQSWARSSYQQRARRPSTYARPYDQSGGRPCHLHFVEVCVICRGGFPLTLRRSVSWGAARQLTYASTKCKLGGRPTNLHFDDNLHFDEVSVEGPPTNLHFVEV